MSWTDEEIDNLFKEGANAQSFEYDNAYFGEVEAALPISKKGKDFLWMGTALVFVAVLTTGFFVNNTSENTFSIGNGQLADLELSKDNQESNKENTTSTNKDTQNENAELSNNQVQTSDINEQYDAGSTALEAGKNVATSNSKNNGINPSTVVEQQQSMYDLATRNVRSKNGSTAGQSNANDAHSGSVPSGRSNLMALRNDAEKGSQHKYDFVVSPITAGLDVKSPDLLDQDLNRNVLPNALPDLGQLRPKAMLYIELNGGLSQSLITPSEYTSRSYGGGIGVESYLGNFNLTSGLNFKVSDHQDLILSRAAEKLYNFGSTTEIGKYDFKRLYSIEVPISVGYNFGKHNVNLGVRPSFLIGAKMKHQVFNNGKLLRSRESNGLIDGGLKVFGMKPIVGYAYRMNKWTVGANIGVQLMQSVDEEFIQGVNNPFPVDGQIYLRRTIRLRR